MCRCRLFTVLRPTKAAWAKARLRRSECGSNLESEGDRPMKLPRAIFLPAFLFLILLTLVLLPPAYARGGGGGHGGGGGGHASGGGGFHGGGFAGGGGFHGVAGGGFHGGIGGYRGYG